MEGPACPASAPVPSTATSRARTTSSKPSRNWVGATLGRSSRPPAAPSCARRARRAAAHGHWRLRYGPEPTRPAPRRPPLGRGPPHAPYLDADNIARLLVAVTKDDDFPVRRRSSVSGPAVVPSVRMVDRQHNEDQQVAGTDAAPDSVVPRGIHGTESRRGAGSNPWWSSASARPPMAGEPSAELRRDGLRQSVRSRGVRGAK